MVKLDAVCEELERVRRSGTVLLDEMFERQRRRTHLEDFAAAALLDTDGPAWVDAQGNETSLDAAVPEGWGWVCDWKTDWFEELSDADCWNYALHFNAPAEQWQGKSDGSCLVRRRRWVRIRQLDSER